MSKTEQNTPGWQAIQTILLLCLVLSKATLSTRVKQPTAPTLMIYTRVGTLVL
jgi:hypothetical protein